MAWFSALLQSLPFANPAMLLWGLAAAVPILIHLWSRRKYREVPWAAMEFLLAAAKKNARRIRLEQLLLLLTRVAILLLLAAALADPAFSWLRPAGASPVDAERTLHVLVLDGSYSMDLRAGERTRFQRAQDWASQRVRESRQGDGFTLLLMAERPEILISDPAFEPEDVVDEIASQKVRHEGARLAPLLAEVERMLRADDPELARLTRRSVCFFTDLGRNTWGEVNTPACRQSLGRIAERAALTLCDVGENSAANAAVVSLALDDPLVTAGRAEALQAELQNFGVEPLTGARVLGFVDDQQVHAETLTIPALGRVAVRFNAGFTLPGEHQVEVRLAGDGLEVDNHRWLSVPVRDAVEVLCIEGQAGSARHVALALEPERSPRPRIRVRIAMENALTESPLAGYDAVFLCNVARFTEDETRLLYDYVRGGGGAVVCLGDRAQLESYNERLGAAPHRLLPAPLIDVASASPAFFDPLEYRHPIVAAFAGHERSGLLTTPVWRYVRTRPQDPSAARVALAYDNGDPAILEEEIERGRCILVTTALSPESLDRSTTPPTPWSAWASWPSFPPLIQELLRRAARSHEGRNVRVGQPLEGREPETLMSVPLTVETPRGQVARVPLQIDGTSSRWVFENTASSGIYTARFAEPVAEERRFAVNVDPRESDLERLDREALPSQFDSGAEGGEPAGASAAVRDRQAFRYALALLLAMLLGESLLGYHFGKAAA